jgi:hypothetical protein
LNLGAAQYLVKPISRGQLYDAIGKAVSPKKQANSVLLVSPEPVESAPPAPAPQEKKQLILVPRII